MKRPKPFYASRTLWLQVLLLAEAIIQMSPDLRPLVPIEYMAIFTAILAVANAVTRLNTHQPIKGTKAAGE